MKIIITIVLFLAFTVANAQKIVSNQKDFLTGTKKIESSAIVVMPGMENNLMASLSSIGESYFLKLTGNFGVGPITNTDGFTFFFDDMTFVTVFPVSAQGIAGYGKTERYEQRYKISKEELLELSAKKTISARRIYAGKKVEAVVSEDYATRLKNLAVIFLEELNKK